MCEKRRVRALEWKEWQTSEQVVSWDILCSADSSTMRSTISCGSSMSAQVRILNKDVGRVQELGGFCESEELQGEFKTRRDQRFTCTDFRQSPFMAALENALNSRWNHILYSTNKRATLCITATPTFRWIQNVPQKEPEQSSRISVIPRIYFSGFHGIFAELHF